MPRRGENIYKRKDGRWEGRYIKCHINGKAQYGYIYAKSYKEAKELLNQAKNLNINTTTKVTKSDKTQNATNFYEISTQWLNMKATTIKLSTYTRYSNLLNTYLYPQYRDTFIEDISPTSVNSYINMLLTSGKKNKTGLAPKTVQCIISLLKSILDYAYRTNHVSSISTSYIKIKQEQEPMHILSIADQNALTAYIYENPTPTNIGILLCLYTGMRIGEICALKWNDILWDEHCVLIEKTLQRLQNSTDIVSKTSIVITSPKSSCSIRKVPLPDELYNVLQKHKQNDETFILTGTISYIEPRTMQNRYKSILKQCKIKDINFHSLRHTFATRCIELGFDVKSLSEVLGHANVNITLNRYVHPSMEQKQRNMNLLTELLSVK